MLVISFRFKSFDKWSLNLFKSSKNTGLEKVCHKPALSQLDSSWDSLCCVKSVMV